MGGGAVEAHTPPVLVEGGEGGQECSFHQIAYSFILLQVL